mmetsp:Transcript_9266/g.12917  ORF Transcript_9266/g.12917 Transcript_9266/m.12917 type:complete len:97 (-) Transcript_9266:249-539(-)
MVLQMRKGNPEKINMSAEPTSSSKPDEDVVPPPEDDDEDEEYEKQMDADEALVTKEERDQELADLKDEAEMSIEELRKKYYGGGAGNGAADEEGES